MNIATPSLDSISQRIAKQTVSNLQIPFDYKSAKYTTFSSDDLNTIQADIQAKLKGIFTQLGAQMREIQESPDLDSFCQEIAGQNTKDPRFDVTSGAGLHFTGLTKIYYDRSWVSKLTALSGWSGWAGLAPSASEPPGADAYFVPMLYMSSYPKIDLITHIARAAVQKFTDRPN